MEQQLPVTSDLLIEMSGNSLEKKNDSQLEDINTTHRKRECADQKSEIIARKRYTGLMIKSCENLSQADFSIFPLVLPFQIPTVAEDFDIPDKWKTAKKHVVLPRYRTLAKSLYKLPLQRGSCCTDDLPQCACLPLAACDAGCQNRLLFM